jgi:hypothetical protein
MLLYWKFVGETDGKKIMAFKRRFSLLLPLYIYRIITYYDYDLCYLHSSIFLQTASLHFILFY